MPDASPSTFVKGLAGVVAAQTALSSVDGTNGVLTYRGIDIHDLAETTQFEEAVHLLWHGKLPNAAELTAFKKELAAERKLPRQILELIRSFPKKAVPMEALRTAVSALAFSDPETEDISPEATLRKGLRLTAKMPTIVAAFHRLRKGKEPVAPKASIDHAANFLYMLTGEMPDELTVRAMNLYLVLLADHSLNASTFTARVVSSTNGDLHSAVTAAIGALKGNLHGGAAEATMNMLLEIGAIEKVDSFVDNAFDTKRKIMGFGHRIYKTGDPRVRHLQAMARKMENAAGKGHNYVDMALAVESAVNRHRELYPNVDYFSAPMLYYIGVPVDLDTCVFAVSRIAGWTAHVLEQYADAALIRPAAEYVGPTGVKFVPLNERN
ncbi:MAG: citrate synthase [Chloroflexi bacterium]|nr:citrate synthase [Chloroflexota bacterium]